MKLSLGLAAALAGYVAAAQQAAEVYILPNAASQSTSTSTPSISRTIARLILLQRLAPAGKGPSISQIPHNADLDNVAAMMNQFGKQPVSLFGEGTTAGVPSQLVMMLEGLTEDQLEEIGGLFKSKPSFTIDDVPTSGANDKLLSNDFYNVGVTKEHSCSLSQVSNPFEEDCWSGRSTAAKYNVRKNPETLKEMIRQVPRLAKLASSGEMETTVILLPAHADNAPKQWSDGPQELRRRQAEQVISAFDGTQKIGDTAATQAPSSFSSSSSTDNLFNAVRGKVAACFNSEESCMSATGNCSSHGSCANKYGKNSKDSCFVCSCLSTKSEKSGSVTHWAGPTCAKKDVSVPFWLFVTFTLMIVGTLTLSIGLLFGVGEQKMPGVLGAGVSRSK